MVSQGFINMSHIPSEYNLANILLKYWSYQSLYENLIKLILHYHGNGDEYLMANTIDISSFSQDGFEAVCISDTCGIKFLSTGDFFLKDVH